MVAKIGLLFGAGATKRKQKIAVVAIRKDWMVKAARRKDFTFDDSKIGSYGRFEVIRDDIWMPEKN